MFVGFSLSKETHHRSKTEKKEIIDRRPKTRGTSLRFRSKFTCIDLCAYLSLFCALTREEEEKKKNKEEQQQHRREVISETTTSERRRQQREEKKSARQRHHHHHLLKGNWAPKGTKNCRFIFLVPFRVFKVVSTLRKKNTRKRTTQIFYSSSS